ncbi:MAG: winged helix-turn-helix transcriptional regulator [Herpetosiphonaceae bacterium]|nr:winged helix-turn-helix transcriptional regulator [Herpetosiphonaceae bacterium]
METPPTPKTVFIIRDLETLRVIADPVRMQIFETLTHATLSPKLLAHKLGLATSKLYYHLNLLEQHGLIAVAETVMVANLQEKRYRATALYLDTDPALLALATTQGQDTVLTVLASTLNTTREDIFRSLRVRAAELAAGSPANPRHFVISRQSARMTEERADEFRSRLAALLEEFGGIAGEPESPAADPIYAFTVAFYPTIHFNDDQPSAE